MANDGQKSSGKKFGLIIFIVLLVGIGITYLIFNFTYSEGNRAGMLIRFAKKGFVFKTYEGEMNLGGVGSVPNTALQNQSWYFSVTNQAIADSLMHLEGKKVSLHYRQILRNMPWQGETKFFVDGIQVLP